MHSIAYPKSGPVCLYNKFNFGVETEKTLVYLQNLREKAYSESH